MKNVVNKANFTHYPKLMEMIGRCERLYEEVSQSLIQEGKLGLYEDERLFINMIHRLNEQVMDTAQEEGADVDARKERRQTTSPAAKEQQPSPAFSSRSSLSSHSASQASTLRNLVEENAMNKSSKEGLARVCESEQNAANTVKAASSLSSEAKRAAASKASGEGKQPTSKRARHG
jgi:hypothetical protein